MIKPVQKPTTQPTTIDSCSRAIKDPRTSGGLISAMYTGVSVLGIVQHIVVRLNPTKICEVIMPECTDTETAYSTTYYDVR